VDTEHGNLDDAAMHEAVQAIAGCSVSPVVRIPACEGWMFKRELYILWEPHWLVQPINIMSVWIQRCLGRWRPWHYGPSY
jgi:hypothetical protein